MGKISPTSPDRPELDTRGAVISLRRSSTPDLRIMASMLTAVLETRMLTGAHGGPR
jgi:hypothetical protein